MQSKPTLGGGRHTRDQKPFGGQHAQAGIDLGAGTYDHASVVWLNGIPS